MNFNNLLNQVLGAVQQSGNKVMSDNNPLNSFGGGALIGGLAAMLLKKGGTKSLLKAGSAAALGMMAYQAYQNWQGGRQNSTSTVAALPEAAFAARGQLAGERSRVILRTMIAAAASDGLIDETEKQLIAQEGGADAEVQQWLANEYARPASINELAEAVAAIRHWLPKPIWLPARFAAIWCAVRLPSCPGCRRLWGWMTVWWSSWSGSWRWHNKTPVVWYK